MQTSDELIHLKEASVLYAAAEGTGHRALSGVSLSIGRGDWLSVIGRNGSGKSTLASVLLRLCPLSRGTLELRGGVVVRAVLQSPDAQLTLDTVEEEFAHIVGPGRSAEPSVQQSLQHETRGDFIRAALARVGLKLPQEAALAPLSGGQKQLLNIAIALAAEPDVLLLDEPTAMLDPASRDRVLQAVRQAHREGTTIIWITHHLEEVADATRVVVFEDGRAVYEGSPRQFFYGAEGDALQASGTFQSLSPCREFGMEPPFVVRTAEILIAQGYALQPKPLREDELAKAVTAR